MTDTFKTLVRINAPSLSERPLANFLKSRLKRYPMVEDHAGKALGGQCGNLLVRVKGDNRSPVLFCAHMDTISPTRGIRMTQKRGVLQTDGKTILGADDRAGIAAILELVAHLEESGMPHPPLELLFTVAEEPGLQGIKQFCPKSLRAKAGYVLDSTQPVGSAVHSAVAMRRMSVCVKGKTAHSGIDPEKGVNAIHIASRALAGIRSGKISRHTSVNIGTIKGGSAVNIVPDETRVEIEIRSIYPAAILRLSQRIRRVFEREAVKACGKVRINEWTEFGSFYVPKKALVSRLFCLGARALGLDSQLECYGGGSDGNVLNAMGISCLVVGLGYEFPHTTRERMPVSNLTASVRLLESILNAWR